MSKVFVTGASGLLGSALVDALAAAGYEITVLLRNAAGKDAFAHLPCPVHVVEGDILDPLLLRKVLPGHTHLVHAAAVVSFAPKRRAEMYETNVRGTANVVNAAVECGVERFAHISSVAALGRAGGAGKIIDENTKWESSGHNTHYAKSKYLAEQEVYRGGEEGLNFFIVNPSIILAPGRPERSSGRLIEKIRQGTRFYPSGNLNYVDLRDVTDAVMALLPTAHTGRFVLNGGHITYREFMTVMAQKLSVKAPAYRAGRLLTALAWRAEALRCLITGNEPLLTAETARASASVYHYSSARYTGATGLGFRAAEDTFVFSAS